MAAQKTKNPKNVKAVFLYVPCPSMKVAKALGMGLVRSKRASCVNILSSMTDDPYEAPCLAKIDIAGLNASYLTWMSENFESIS